MTEKEWQAVVVDLAHLFGWTVFHPYQSMRSEPGYPDLTLVRDRAVWIELKTERGTLSADQEKWRDALIAAGAEWHLFRPSELEQVAAVLRRRQAA